MRKRRVEVKMNIPQEDEFLNRTILQRKEAILDAKFFQEEYKRAGLEIARLDKLRESYLRSYFTDVIEANKDLAYLNNDDISVKFEKEGFKETKFYVEELRRFLFKDFESEALRKYNCVGIERTSHILLPECKLSYKFYNGKNLFSVKIPYKDDVEHALSRRSREECRCTSPFSYGTIDVVLHFKPRENDSFDEVKVVSSHDFEEIRNRIVEAVESDFAEEKKRAKSRDRNIIEC